ncbi:MAG: hypothetical protein ACT4QF_08445 [Sporichthyaceae bacterium]
MGVEKFSVSFESDLGQAIRDAAADGDASVSAWLAEAARNRLRSEALTEAVAAWEEHFGALTEDEMAAAARVLDGPATPVRKRATKRAVS